MTNCEIERAVNKTSEYFHKRINVPDTSKVCSSKIMEIQMYRQSSSKFSRKRRQALIAGLAAGTTYLASSLFSHLISKGKNSDMIDIDKSINMMELKQMEDEAKVEKIGQNIAVEIDVISKSLDEIQRKMCIGGLQLDATNFENFVRSIATTFITKTLFTIESISSNMKGNDCSVTSVELCKKMNDLSKNSENEQICSNYVYKQNFDLNSVQIHKKDETVKIIITVMVKLPRFTQIKSEIFDLTTVPIPTRKTENNLYEYIKFQYVPEKFVTLTDHNQTLAITQNMCDKSEKYLYCYQNLFDNIHSEETSCVNALLGKNRINSCNPKRIISISDCISQINENSVVISVSDSMRINAHIRDLQIHRLNIEDAYQKGSYALTKKELQYPAYLSCATSKVFIDLTESSETTITVQNNNFSEKYFSEEIEWMTTLNRINNASVEKLKSEIDSLHPINENLIQMMNITRENRLKELIPKPEFFKNENFKKMDNSLGPYAVILSIILSILTLGTIMINIIICIKTKCKKTPKRYNNVRFV